MKDIKSFGVLGDGTDETEKIQKAIDECSENNEVLQFSEGIFATLSLKLQNNTKIVIDEGARIEAYKEWHAWEKVDKMPLLFADNKKNIEISGKGTIFGNSEFFHDPEGEIASRMRPSNMVQLDECENVVIDGIKFEEAVCVSVYLNKCKNVKVNNVKVRNPEWWKCHKSDGIDIVSSKDVTVTNCDIETGNDAIAIKTPEKIDAENIKISDCILRTTRTAIKIGTDICGDVKNVDIQNIKIYDHRRRIYFRHPEQGGHVYSALALITNGGGNIENVKACNIFAEIVSTPVFIAAQRYAYVKNPTFGSVKNVTIDSMTAASSLRANQINIQKEALAENIKFVNSKFFNVENPNCDFTPKENKGYYYPAGYTFGHMPAYGLYAVNVKNIEIENTVFEEDLTSGRPETVIIEKEA